MKTNEVTAIIVDAAYQVHLDVGPGLFESVYEAVFARALTKRGLTVKRQVIVPIRIGDETFDEGFRADLIVEGLVIIEIKSIDRLAPVHKKQMLRYLKLSGIPAGLLINFGGTLLRGNIERLAISGAPDLKQEP